MTSNWNEEYIKKNKIVFVDNDRNTRLHYAAANGNIEEVKEEIANGRKLDPENYLGWTPLMMAVRNNHIEIIDLLLANFANVTKENRFGVSVFLMSIVVGNLDLVKKLLEHLLTGGVSRRIIQKTLSPLSLSILFGHKQIFRFLIERSFDVNAATPKTQLTPLMFAASVSNSKIIRELLAKNANVHAKNLIGRTAQDILQARGQAEIDIKDDLNLNKSPEVPQILIHSPQQQLSVEKLAELSASTTTTTICPSPLTPLTLIPQFTKSSNVTTPAFCYSPNLSPIISVALTPCQMFFPTNFHPNQFYQYNMSLSNNSNDYLNTTMTSFSNEVFYV